MTDVLDTRERWWTLAQLILGITDRNRKWWTLAAMTLAVLMMMLDTTAVNIALTPIGRSLGASLAELQWVINAYLITVTVFLVVAGRLGDVYGRRRMLIVGLSVFTVASAAIGLSFSTLWMIVWRAVQGVGAAFILPLTLSLVDDAFPGALRPRAIAIWGGFASVAVAAGPAVGGVLAQVTSGGWRLIFLLNVPVSIASIFVVRLTTLESRDPSASRSIDGAGLVLLFVGLTAVVFGLVQTGAAGRIELTEVGAVAGGIAALAAFCVVELKRRNPLVQLRLLRNKTFLGSNAISFLSSFALLGLLFFLPIYFQTVGGHSPVVAGLALMPTTIVMLIISPLSPVVSRRFGPRTTMAVGMAVTAGALIQMSFLSVHSTFLWFLPALVEVGIGWGLLTSPISAVGIHAVPSRQAGAASGILSMSRMSGSAFGVAVTVMLLNYLKQGDVPAAVATLLSSEPQHGATVDRAKQLFVFALSGTMRVTGLVAAAGVLIAIFFVSRVRE